MITIDQVLSSGVKAETLMFYEQYSNIFEDFRGLGNTYNSALELAADKCSVSRSTVERAVKVTRKVSEASEN